jgi:hypothetical protein
MLVLAGVLYVVHEMGGAISKGRCQDSSVLVGAADLRTPDLEVFHACNRQASFFHACNGLFHNEQLGTKNGVRRLTANICVSDPVCGKFHSCDGKKYGFLPLLQQKSGQGIDSAMLYAVDKFHRHALAESLQS